MFTADLAGTYTILLTVNNGAEDSPTDELIITALPPMAIAGADQKVLTASIVKLDASLSSDDTGNNLTYTWTMLIKPLDSLAVLSGVNLINPNFVADMDGQYRLSLMVNNGFVDSSTDIVIIESTTLPIASAGLDQNVSVNERVTLNASKSTDSQTRPLVFRWSTKSIPNGSAAVLSNSATETPSFLPDKQGLYEFNLIVDNGVDQSDLDSVVINAQLPIANAGIGINTTPGNIVILDGRNSVDPNRNKIAFNWSVIDSPLLSSPVLSNNTISTPSFNASAIGAYQISLIVNNGFTDGIIDTLDINIRTSVANNSSIFSTDFEDPTRNADWSADAGIWGAGTPTSGPGLAFIGLGLAGTVLDGNYVDHVSSRFVSPVISLPTVLAGEEIRIKYWHWFSFYPGRRGTPNSCDNSSPQDSGSFQVTVESAPGVWGPWAALANYVLNSSWSRANIGLTPYAGKNIQIGFQIINPVWTRSCVNGTAAGWYVDEVIIEKKSLP